MYNKNIIRPNRTVPRVTDGVGETANLIWDRPTTIKGFMKVNINNGNLTFGLTQVVIGPVVETFKYS